MKTIKYALTILFLSSFWSLNYANNSDRYFTKVVNLNFDDTVEKVTAEFKKHGFGVVTELNMEEKINPKVTNKVMQPYKILGLCNAIVADKAIQAEENIGLFLPCKAIVKYKGENKTEVVIINPSSLMKGFNNQELTKIAKEITSKFETVIQNL